MDKKDNLNKLKGVIANIEKSYGKGSIMMLGKKDHDINVEIFSTGSLGHGLPVAAGMALAAKINNENNRAFVLLGDAADEDLLREENIENTDVFCALTNADEANIISSMLAKRLGAKTVMALINRAAYVDLVQRDIIDIAISPQQATIGSLLAHVRRGDVVKVHSLRGGAAEAVEAIAHGNARQSKVVGRKIDDLKLPPGVVIGAIVRKEEVIVVHHDTLIVEDDHVILVVTDKRHVSDVEKLFQVNLTSS